MLHDALLYDELKDDMVQCNLCAHRCKIKESQRGICRVRENRNGKLYSLVYGNLISKNVDPIEKKPLYHFFPGSKSFSVATPGCNFRCSWCQNWQISQMPRQMKMPEYQRIMPKEIVRQAVGLNCQSIAYTYTEPTIFFEYNYDIARAAKNEGLQNVYVTNGFMTSEMIEMIAPYLDAANIDIKAFRDETYRTQMGGQLEPVLESCRLMKSKGIWLEITTLIVPKFNDSMEEINELATFIYEELGAETPWHLSRFYPQYQLCDVAPTQESTLYEAKQIGESVGLKYVYLGNVFGHNATKCHHCGHELITRTSYPVRFHNLGSEGECLNCGTTLVGVGLDRQF